MSSKKDVTKKKIGWAVVGLGLQGERLTKAIRKSSRGTLVATVSQRVPGSFRRALADKAIQAVAIASANHRHAADVLEAMRAGKDVLIEKPLALSVREAHAIEREAGIHKSCRLAVDYHLRTHPEVRHARGLLARGALGRITFIDMQWSIGGLAKGAPPLPKHMAWREDPKKSGGGALMARGVHLFDLLRFLTGDEITTVRAWSDADPTHVDRTAIALLTLSSGTPVHLTTSKVTPHAHNHISIYGTKGTISLSKLFRDDPAPMYAHVLDAFIDMRSGKKTSLATLRDGVKCVQVAEAFKKAAVSGKAVRLR